jgi:hypothetical protein
MNGAPLLGSLLLAGAALTVASRVEAAILYTAPLDQVVAHSTHIALGQWDAASGCLTPARWYRGAHPAGAESCAAFQVWSPTSYVSDKLARVRERARRGDAQQCGEVSDRVVMFLEACDGRLHMTGLRPGDGFSAHASVRMLTSAGHVLRLEQVINPGGPEPVLAEKATWREFEPHLVELIAEHPYRPSSMERVLLVSAHRDAFFDALGGTLDWYQGDWPTDIPGWSSRVADAQAVAVAATRMAAWAASVPAADRAPALTALALLSTWTGPDGPGRTAPLEALDAVARSMSQAGVRAWARRWLHDAGCSAPRVHVVRLLGRYGAEAFEEALAALEARILKDPTNAGTSAAWALRELGYAPRAEAALQRATRER